PLDTVLPAAASRSPQTTYAAFAAGSLCSAATAYNARRRAIAPAAGHARLSSLPSAGPPTAAPPPKPPVPSALSSPLPAPALAVLETAGHSHITYCLSVTRVCPLLGLVSKKNITSCHAPQPPPPILRYARFQALVQTPRHVLIYDTGPWFSEDFDSGEAVIAPYLQHQGIDYVNTVMISHGDSD